MAKTEQYIIDEIVRQDDDTFYCIGAGELAEWYRNLPLRRVRRLCQIPTHWRDQADYPPMAALIKLYEDFLAMTEGKEEEATYTLGYRDEPGYATALYVVETYEYLEEKSGQTIQEQRWYELAATSGAYFLNTGYRAQEDLGKLLDAKLTKGVDPRFTIHGYTMICRGGLEHALFYTKTWYIIEGIVRTSTLQETYKRKGGYLQMIDRNVYGPHT